MEITPPIRLLKTRDLSEVINDSLGFLKKHIQAIGKVMLLLVLPLLIIAGFFMSKYFALVGSAATLQSGEGIQSFATTVGSVMIGYIGYILAIVFLHLLIYQAFLLYEEGGSENVTADNIFAGIRNDVWRFIGFNFVLGLVFMLVFSLFIGAIVFSAAVLKMWALVAIVTLLTFLVVFYVALALSFSGFIFLRERTSIFSAIGRSFTLIKGYWWRTFGVFFVAMMIVYFGSIVFTIPFYALFFMKMMHTVQSNPMDLFNLSPLQTASFVFLITGSSLLYSLFNVSVVFQYYNLVETKEGAGLMEEINQIGTTE